MTLDHAPGARLPHEFGAVELKTERLILQLPRPSDVATIAKLANDRLLAEATARVPFPLSARGRRALGRRGGDLRRPRHLRPLHQGGRALHRRLRAGAPRNADSNSAIGSASPIATAGWRPRRRAPRLISASPSCTARSCSPRHASTTRRRGGCWRSAASSGPASRWSAPRCWPPPCRSTAFRLDRKSWAGLRSWGSVPLTEGPSIQAA